MTLPGARGAALVEWISGLALGKVGEAPDGDHEAMAAHLADFARAAAEHAVFAGPQAAAEAGAAGEKGPLVEDVVVATRTAYHLVRFVEAPYEGGVFLHLWLDRSHANLALALMRLRDLAQRLVLA
ncbi:hypothetical protein [Actinacidiphila reveromycinica]